MKKTWGFVESQDGFKITDKNNDFVVLAGGGSAKMSVNINTSTGEIGLEVGNYIYTGGEQLPSDNSKLVYITYAGTSSQTIYLPTTPVIGKSVQIMNPTSNTVIVQTNAGNTYGVPGTVATNLYYNGVEWIITDYAYCQSLI